MKALTRKKGRETFPWMGTGCAKDLWPKGGSTQPQKKTRVAGPPRSTWKTKQNKTSTRFLNLINIDILVIDNFVMGVCPKYSRMLSGIPGLQPLDISRTSPQMSPGMVKCPLGNKITFG